MRTLTYLSLITAIILTGCVDRTIHNSPPSNQCNNLKFSVGRLFPKETIKLYYDGKIILRYKVDSLDGFRFKRDFCIDFKDSGALKVVSELNDKIYLDTTIKVRKMAHGYFLMVSVPHPKAWKKYYENSTVPIKEWGYLSIDSCVRLISLQPDTIFKNTWSDSLAN